MQPKAWMLTPPLWFLASAASAAEEPPLVTLPGWIQLAMALVPVLLAIIGLGHVWVAMKVKALDVKVGVLPAGSSVATTMVAMDTSVKAVQSGQKDTQSQIAAVNTKAEGIETRAAELDRKVDGVKADVKEVHEATNGLSHRLAEASGDAGFGRGQEKERGDQRLRVAEAAAASSAVPTPVAVVGPLPTAEDARAAMLKKIEGLLAEFQAMPTGPAQPEPPRATLRNAVASIQETAEDIKEQTDKLTFTKPNVVDAGEPPKG